jgi:uncharacterized repeat protein (TIGR03803 family)
MQGGDGDLYGTTSEGGPVCQGVGCGTVFRVSQNGALKTLANFDGADGLFPMAGLTHTANEYTYGVTQEGGVGGMCNLEEGCGTVFEITPAGALKTLYNFCMQGGYRCSDGAFPFGNLIQGTDGNLYGTTQEGGNTEYNYGTVFRVTPGGILTILYNFCSLSGCADGFFPEGGLVQGTDGKLYGSTVKGGTNDYGTLFSLSIGLSPFVKTQPTSRVAGASVQILGMNLLGATSVTFNGTAATFTVVSRSLITTTVPIGATTGTVQVVTPGGTLSSNVPFTVKP